MTDGAAPPSAPGGSPPLDGPVLVLGLGVTGRAVARALARRGVETVLVDDHPSPAAEALVASLGVSLEVAPDEARLDHLLSTSASFVPSPGVPEHHPAFARAEAAGVPRVGELDLAATWDPRPCLAITGTDGKTTVTTMVTAALTESGVAAVEAGNTEVPLVEAIDDPTPDVFVVEASSFRLAPLRCFRPRVGTWLNFAPDHQDVHRSLGDYEAAKGRLFELLTERELAVGNADDPVVAGHLARAPRHQSFGLGGPGTADWHVAEGRLRGPGGLDLCGVDDLVRSLPHDVANALAAAASALGAEVGATADGTTRAVTRFRSLPHRVALVGESGGVRWYDDSKATAPHATLAALAGFESVVLIAGGRNKGLDLGALADAAPRIRAVVAIGDAAPEVAEAFDGLRPVTAAASMDEAVAQAAARARPGDAVVLSPACASFDWYSSYAERGDDFVRAVREVAGVEAPS